MARKAAGDEWAAIISASPHALAFIGPDGVVRACNPATHRILGVDASDVVGRLLSAVLGFDDPGMLRLLAQWPDMDHEFRHTRGDGTAVDISFSVSAYAAGGNPRAGYVAVFSDVTKRKLIDKHIQRSRRLEAMARLVGGVAHDFNNLLQVISGRAKLAKDAIRDGDDARPHIEEIEAAARQASDHTRQLLAFSQQQELRPHVLRIDTVIRKAEPMLKRVIGPGIDVVIRTGAGDARVTADQQQVERLLAHLAINARAAMPGGGTFTLESARIHLDDVFTARHPLVRPGEYVGIRVSDTGVGMDEPTMLRLFEPFFTTKEPGEGIGLGLATVFGIVKQSGGHIVAESEPGIGSTFRILFPPAPAARPSGSHRQTNNERIPLRSSGVRTKTHGESVMIVEDTASVRRMMALALARQGFEIIEAAAAEEALVKAAEAGNTLRVLVADVSLPGLSGVELAHRIAASHPHTTVILVSGYGVEHVAIKKQIRDRTVMLEKPFSVPDFLRTVREQAERAAKAAARGTRRKGDKPARTKQGSEK